MLSSHRLISTGQLHALPRFHIRPINPVVWLGASRPKAWKSHLEAGFPLRCFQRLSQPRIATLHVLLVEQLAHQRLVRPGPLVLRTALLKTLTRAADRDRTVSRRSKPSSRTALMGEQPNPWDLLQPQDATSRHRGAKPCRRYGRSGKISLLSPGYLLSVDRCRFHMPTPGH